MPHSHSKEKTAQLRVRLNGTSENRWHKYGLKQNPFPQFARAETDAAMRQLNSLDGDPLTGPDDIRTRLKGWSDEFIDLCIFNYKAGESVEFIVLFPTKLGSLTVKNEANGEEGN